MSAPVFRIGETNHHVKPGDLVWADNIEIERTPEDNTVLASAVTRRGPVRGYVTFEGTVFLVKVNRLVPLDQCRLEKEATKR